MNIMNLIFNPSGVTSSRETNNTATYADMLGLNREFKFVLSKTKIKDQGEFDALFNEAKASLDYDLKRFGEQLEVISPMLRNKLNGSIGSMTLLADDDGKVTIKFHRRDEDGFWDGKSAKYPEKDTTAKYKKEIFFLLDDE